MKRKMSRKGQGTLEYAIIIVVVIGALIAMQWYVKGGYQGRLRASSDDMGDQFGPTTTSGSIVTTHNSQQTDNTAMGTGATTTSHSQSQTKQGSEVVAGLTPTADQR
ncbi:MAG: hypothetical protein V1923_04600 [Candidatus Omnitrophota bacterium]